MLGAIYTVIAMTFYLAIGHFFDDTPAELRPTFKEQVIIYANWYGPSALGGIIGGLAGFFTKKSPYMLLILLLGLILQMAVNGRSSWNNIIGGSQNVTFCLMITGIILYLVIWKHKIQVKKDKNQQL